jgi:hypothetical protein
MTRIMRPDPFGARLSNVEPRVSCGCRSLNLMSNGRDNPDWDVVNGSGFAGSVLQDFTMAMEQMKKRIVQSWDFCPTLDQLIDRSGLIYKIFIVL